MPKRYHLRADDPIEPPYKKVKENKTEPSKPNLCDLPTEVLQKILNNINIWHMNRVRATSKRLRDVNDSLVMHKFNKALNDFRQLDPNSKQSISLWVIQLATKVYVREGFESTFSGCILPMLRSSYKDPFSPGMPQISIFLTHFYKIVEQNMETKAWQYSRLLYTVQLLQFFRHYNNHAIISNEFEQNRWRIVIELRGPWLCSLWSKGQPSENSEMRSQILVMLAELLIANKTGRSFKRVFETESNVYLLGNDTSDDNRKPGSTFVFAVQGSESICTIFRDCYEQNIDALSWPTEWPNDQFTANLNIACPAGLKWGCPQSLTVDFGSSEENNYVGMFTRSRKAKTVSSHCSIFTSL